LDVIERQKSLFIIALNNDQMWAANLLVLLYSQVL
jgi:hypothetical protein